MNQNKKTLQIKWHTVMPPLNNAKTIVVNVNYKKINIVEHNA